MAIFTVALGVGANTAIIQRGEGGVAKPTALSPARSAVMLAATGSDSIHPVTVDFTTTHD